MKLPELFVKRMSESEDVDIQKFLDSYNAPPEHGIRLNPCKDVSLVNQAFGNMESVSWCELGFYADKDVIKGNHPYHMAGLFYFQEPSAMCAAELLPLESGDVVLDLCAAPGGKSTQIAAHSDITLVSNEIVSKRSLVLSENIERMGFSNVVVTNESPERLAAKYKSFFDKIIIDAPCSGEGMFKKEPAAVEAWSVEHVLSCASRQRKIIDSAMEMLKPGGGIVYSTCTFSKEENDENVSYILENYPFMKVGNVIKLYPHIHRGEGHFAAYIYDTRSSEEFKTDRDKNKYPEDALKLYRDFEKQSLNITLEGEFVLFGENLYLKPEQVPIDGIKTVRPGLHLGICKKGRFEPAHALAKALKPEDFKNTVPFRLGDDEVIKYLKGETVPGTVKGFAVLTCDGLPLGWVKGSDGILKNKLPKGIRIY